MIIINDTNDNNALTFNKAINTENSTEMYSFNTVVLWCFHIIGCFAVTACFQSA